VDASEAKRLYELELENRKLRDLLTEAHLNVHALTRVFGKWWRQALAPQVEHEATRRMVAERHACTRVGLGQVHNVELVRIP
jgi:hypothetical protein